MAGQLGQGKRAGFLRQMGQQAQTAFGQGVGGGYWESMETHYIETFRT
jgi:hypothetical protein